MALPVFSPPIAPTLGMQSSNKPDVVVTAFGDHYSQRIANGLNFNPASCKPGWTGLSAANALLITAFFDARGGWQAFTWARPRDAAPRKWICTTWTQTDELADMVSISADFMEVFDP